MKNKSNAGVRRNPKKEGRPRKIGVERGFGPRHAANAKEGEDLTKRDTDTVPAMLTPREAVLNRNAAEMAGRGNIEALNEKGNELAKRGVDLAGEGENMKSRQKLQGGDDAVKRNPFPGRGAGGVYPGVPPIDSIGGGMPPDQIGGFGGPQPGLAWQHKRNEAVQGPGLDWQRKRAAAVAGGQDQPLMPPGGGPYASPMGYYNGPMPEVPQPMGWQPQPGPMTNGPFYPPGQGLKMAQGEEDILGNSGSIYGNQPPVQLNAPSGLGDILKAIQAEGQKQGLTAGQISGLLKAFQGAGGGGMPSYGEGSATSQALGPALEQAFPGGYQGGISDIGYPPFVAPNAQFHGDKGGWVGPYDSTYMIPAYQRGTGNVPG